jgi:hypothetical protein
MKQLPFKKITIAMLCFLLLVQSFAQQNTVMKKEYKKTGPVYFVNAGDKHAMLSVAVVKEDEKYTCAIQLHDLQNGSVIKQRGINSINNITPEQVIGRMANTLWLYIDSLVGYDVQTLEPVATETAIAAKNPFMQNNFSAYANNYLLDEAAQVMYISAENGERYKLYPQGFLMKPDDTASDPPQDENFSYEYAAEYKVNNRYELQYALTNIDTFNQHLYILGSEKETGQVLSYYGSGIYPERDEMRRLTIIAYNQNGDKIDYEQNKPYSSGKQYFKAGFLQKKFFTSAWHGTNGERLILYEKDKKLSVCLIDKNGNEKWNINTKQFVNNFIDYLVDDKYLVMWFISKDDSFISIDLSAGTAVQP